MITKKLVGQTALFMLPGLLTACSALQEGPMVSSTPQRPQLTARQATQHTMANYFSQARIIEARTADPWDPAKHGIGNVLQFKPTFIVAADGSGTHKTIQSAIDAMTAKGGSNRFYILIKPGVYREQVCLKETAPVTLYGESTDASQVVIINNYGSATKKVKDVPANACESRKGADTYGTSGSSTFLAYSDGFQAKNITFANDFDENPSPNRGTQAVALNVRGDKAILENVRLLGEQDTVMFKSKEMGLINRAFVTNSYIEGDVDFVFGRGVVVFDQVEFKSLTARHGAEGGFVFAPSQPDNYPYGYLVVNSRFTSDGNPSGKSIHLGRAWDEGSKPFEAQDGSTYYPNGMVVIRDSWIGAHIDKAAPWAAAASTGRPFDSEKTQSIKFGNPKADTLYPANRMYEFRNKGPGAAAK